MTDRVIDTNVQGIVDRALDNSVFQEWLVEKGFALRSPQINIESFREVLRNTQLSPVQGKTLKAFEPFGYLTTLPRIARSVYGKDSLENIHTSRVNLARLNTGLQELPDQGLVQKLIGHKSKELRGIGIVAGLTMTELALVHQIRERSADLSSSVANLACDLFITPHYDNPDYLEVAKHNVSVILSRLRRKIPDGILLEEVRRCGILSFRWQTSPDQASIPPSNQPAFV